MALLATASAANRVIERALCVTYSRPAVKGSWSWTNNANVVTTESVAYECHRYASCRYRYVGMDYASAKAAADTIRSNYTRAFWTSEWNGSGANTGTFTKLSMGTKLQGTVEVVRREGHLYDIEVEIAEDDVKMSLSPSASLASLFSSENARTYEY